MSLRVFRRQVRCERCGAIIRKLNYRLDEHGSHYCSKGCRCIGSRQRSIDKSIKAYDCEYLIDDVMDRLNTRTLDEAVVDTIVWACTEEDRRNPWTFDSRIIPLVLWGVFWVNLYGERKISELKDEDRDNGLSRLRRGSDRIAAKRAWETFTHQLTLQTVKNWVDGGIMKVKRAVVCRGGKR